MTKEQFLSKGRYRYEIAEFLHVSKKTLSDFLRMYELDFGNRRIIAPFEIKKLFEKLGL